MPVTERWDSSSGFGFVGDATIADDSIDRFDFFTIGGNGIVNANRGPVFFDAGFDADANAFLIGSIMFTALNTGTVDITTTIDELTSLTNDGFVPLLTEFAGVTVNVVDQVSFDGGVLTITGTADDDVITAVSYTHLTLPTKA